MRPPLRRSPNHLVVTMPEPPHRLYLAACAIILVVVAIVTIALDLFAP